MLGGVLVYGRWSATSVAGKNRSLNFKVRKVCQISSSDTVPRFHYSIIPQNLVNYISEYFRVRTDWFCYVQCFRGSDGSGGLTIKLRSVWWIVESLIIDLYLDL